MCLLFILALGAVFVVWSAIKFLVGLSFILISGLVDGFDDMCDPPSTLHCVSQKVLIIPSHLQDLKHFDHFTNQH